MDNNELMKNSMAKQLKAIADKLEEITNKLKDIDTRLKTAEEKTLQKDFDEAVKKIPAPLTPWSIPTYPNPAPVDDWNTCKVCGIKWGNVGWNYVCGNTACPNRTVWTSSKVELTAAQAPNLNFKTFSVDGSDPTCDSIANQSDCCGKVSFTKCTTCACGQNATCQCDK